MQTLERTEFPALKRLGTQIGYGFAIGVSLVLVYIVQNLEGWGWFPFLTGRFGEVVPLITFSLIIGALAYLAYILYDSQILRWAGEIVTNAVTIIVTWRVFSVFPFDFSAYEFPWEPIARGVMVLAIVGACVGIATNFVKLARSAGPHRSQES